MTASSVAIRGPGESTSHCQPSTVGGRPPREHARPPARHPYWPQRIADGVAGNRRLFSHTSGVQRSSQGAGRVAPWLSSSSWWLQAVLSVPGLVEASLQPLPMSLCALSSNKVPRHWTEGPPCPVWLRLRFITSAKTLFPSKVTSQGSTWV